MAHLVSLSVAKLTPPKRLEMNMNLGLGVLLYLSLGLALSLLRSGQGLSPGDALFCGLFWPMELMRRWIEVLVDLLLGSGREEQERGGAPRGRLTFLPASARGGQRLLTLPGVNFFRV